MNPVRMSLLEQTSIFPRANDYRNEVRALEHSWTKSALDLISYCLCDLDKDKNESHRNE